MTIKFFFDNIPKKYSTNYSNVLKNIRIVCEIKQENRKINGSYGGSM